MSILSVEREPGLVRRTRIARESARYLVMTLIDGIDDPERALAACARHDVEGYWFPAAARAVGRIRSGTIDKHVLALAMERDAERTAEFICLMCLLTGHDAIPGGLLDIVFGTNAVSPPSWGTGEAGEPIWISALARYLWVAAAEGRLSTVDTQAVRTCLMALVKTVPVEKRVDTHEALAKSLPAEAASDGDFSRYDVKSRAFAWTQWAQALTMDREDKPEPTGANSDSAVLWTLLEDVIAAPAPGEEDLGSDGARRPQSGSGDTIAGAEFTTLLVADAVSGSLPHERFVAPLIADDLRALMRHTADRFRTEPKTSTVVGGPLVSVTITTEDPAAPIEEAAQRMAAQHMAAQRRNGMARRSDFALAASSAILIIVAAAGFASSVNSAADDYDTGVSFFFLTLLGVILLIRGVVSAVNGLSRRKGQQRALAREVAAFEAKARQAHAALIHRVQRAEEDAVTIEAFGRDFDRAVAKLEEQSGIRQSSC